MNKRRLSYGLLVTLAAAAFVAGCGDSTPEATTPPQPTASATVEAAPTATVAVEPPPAPAPTVAPAPPPKPSKDKFVGKFVQDFSGDVATAADAAAKKKAGKKDTGDKKYNAAMDKAKAVHRGQHARDHRRHVHLEREGQGGAHHEVRDRQG